MNTEKTMKKLLILFISVVCTIDGFAQDADPSQTNTVVYIQNSTRLADQADVFSVFDEYERPILNRLVEEGALLGYGQMSHSWGDVFNHNVYYVAENKTAFFEAWSKFFSELDLDNELMQETQRKINKHKDNIYVHTAFYGNGVVSPGTVMINQNRVNFADQGEWVSLFREYAYPILKAMVDEGKMNRFGLLLHEWGDEWNVNYYIHTDNQEQFHESWGEYIARFQTDHPDVLRRIVDLTIDHKDNLLYERIPQQD